VAVWLTLAVGLFLWNRQRGTHFWIPVSLMAVAFLAVTGPWSAYSVSTSSQMQRFEALVDEAEMVDEDGLIQPADEVPEETKGQISSILVYFDESHHLAALPHLPEGFTLEETRDTFGFELQPPARPAFIQREHVRVARRDREQVIFIEGYEYLVKMQLFEASPTEVEKDSLRVIYDPETEKLSLLKDGEGLGELPLVETAKTLLAEEIAEDEPDRQRDGRTVEEMASTGETDRIQWMVVFQHVHGYRDRQDGQIHVEGMDFDLLIRLIEP